MGSHHSPELMSLPGTLVPGRVVAEVQNRTDHTSAHDTE